MKKIRQGNDTFFSVLVFNKKAILSEEATHEEDSAVDLSQVKNLKVQGVRLHPESFFFLPSKVEGNLIKVEFPSERQELGAYDVQIDYDTDNETSEDGLLHHRLRLALCRVIETNDYCNEDSADIDAPIKAYILDAFKGVQGEKGERGEQGLQGIQGEKGERGQDGINGTNGENGRDGRDGENGKSALELYNNENNTDYNKITDLFNKLIPKGGEGGTNNNNNNSNEIIDIIDNMIHIYHHFIVDDYRLNLKSLLNNRFFRENITKIVLFKGNFDKIEFYPLFNFDLLYQNMAYGKTILQYQVDDNAGLTDPKNKKILLKNHIDFTERAGNVYNSEFFLTLFNKDKPNGDEDGFDYIYKLENTNLKELASKYNNLEYGQKVIIDVNYRLSRVEESEGWNQAYLYFENA